MIEQVKSYRTIQVENTNDKDIGYVATAKDKGRQKEVGVKIKEPSKVIQIQETISFSNIEQEQKKKERDALAKRLEIA